LKYITEFRNNELAQGLIKDIRRKSKRKVRFMEFCGGHTVAIFKYGIRQALPLTVNLISGPGCPVCVTATADIDKAIALALLPDVIITSFGDMLRVPGSRSSLQQTRATGADVRVVYSTLDALKIARENPGRPVVFIGVGFETTAPTIAVSVLQAREQGIKNYRVLSLHKLCPPVIKTILDAGEVKLDGLICPGHVSAITGSNAWEFVARDYGIPCVVSGFEPADILQCVDMLIGQSEKHESKVEIAYKRGVTPEGNQQAQKIMQQVFETCAAKWRGMGEVPDSGLKLRQEFAGYDAEVVFNIKPEPAIEPKGCLCGEILRGVKTPVDCSLFREICTPENPIGPCMVSSEGSCSAFYQYGDESGR